MIRVIEHHIQKQIIQNLMQAENLRFTDLKPDGMESNAFMYHLKALITDGYIEKTAEGNYKLTNKGLSYVDALSNVNLKPRAQPKLVSIIALGNGNSQWLLAKRKLQPYIGKLMFVSGKQHRGETPAEHAERELQEKTGLQASLTRRGLADIQIYEGEQLITHIVGHVYSGRLTSAKLPVETDQMAYVLHDFSKPSQDLMPGTQELYEYINASDGLFFAGIRASV